MKGRCDYKVETLRLVDDLKMLTGRACYDRIESELMEAEERGRREENEGWQKIVEEIAKESGRNYFTYWILRKGCARLEKK